MNDRIFHAPWLITMAGVFADAGMPLYAVGGAVRNALMDLPASDIDVCGPARPEQVTLFCKDTPVRAELRAAHFGTVELHVEDQTGRHMAEYTTFRVDSYRCGHKPSAVRFADSPAVDALRRDFSVNALYRTLLPDDNAAAEVLDPTGGLEHLRMGVLHTVTADPDRVFKDDGLRILRAARFQAELGLCPTRALLASAAKYAPLLNDIACERLRDELSRLLLADTKYPSLRRTVPPIAAGLTTVRTVDAWQALFGNLRPDDRAIAAIDAYAVPKGFPAVSGKLALLFYRESPDALAAALQRLRYSARETACAQQALTAAQTIASGRCTLMDAVRFGSSPIAHAVAAFTALRTAGEPCDTALEAARSLDASLSDASLPKDLKSLAVRGDDLLLLCQKSGVPASAIGHMLDTLWQATVEGDLPNEHEALLGRARELLAAALR